MLNIFKDIYLNFLVKIGVLFIVFFGVLYLLLADYINALSVWLEIAGVLVMVYLTVAYMVRDLHKKLDEDIAALAYYLRKIEAKKYNAKIQIKNYLEFLELSLLLKNLVKRLNNRDKKGLKK